MRSLPVILICLVTPSLGHTAEVTQMPPALRGDVAIDYIGSVQTGSLSQDGETYGKRLISRHDVLWTLEFAPTDGLSFLVQFDTTPYMNMRFTDSYAMGYDPLTDAGTLEGAEPLSGEPDVSARGMSGVWMGVAAAPFSEVLFGRNDQAAWRLEVAFRTPNANNTLWAYRDDGRGAAPGGSAWRISGAFSADNGIANPYVETIFIHEGRANVDIVDATGTTLATGVSVQPASRIDTRGGVELIGGENRDTGERFAVDLYLGFGYRSWADVASGVLLPSVLDRSLGEVVTESEHLLLSTGLGLDYHLNEYFGARGFGQIGYVTPHRIESPYPVLAGPNTLDICFGLSLEGWIR